MKKRNEILLLLTSLIWGIAFVAQSEGGDAVGPFSYNCIRSFIGGVTLFPVIKLLDYLKLSRKPQNTEEKTNLFKGGIYCGIALFLASSLQQVGINLGTEAGKAGFLTACYIVLVPVLGIFLKKKCGINVWIGVFLTLIGLYLLCMNGSFSIKLSDGLVLVCALVFSIHILVIDHFSPIVDGVRMSCIQFFVCGILSIIPMIVVDMKPISGGFVSWIGSFGNPTAWIAILYGGVMSCGGAYTLQIVGQQNVDPAIASLLLSFESVFSVIAGWIILGEALSIRALVGCAIIFLAVMLAQLPSSVPKKGQ